MGFFDLYTMVSDGSGMPEIYVERRVRGSVDEVWRLTQTPEIHQRWDLRFTEIQYPPRNEGDPQRFLYATLFQAVDERRMLAEAGLPIAVLPWFGWAEIVFGVALLAAWRWRWMFVVNIVLMAAALVGVAVRSPEYVTAAFNPVTLNVCIVALAVVGLTVAKRVPTRGDVCGRSQRRMGNLGAVDL
jgi:hypothetical protein